MRFSLARRQDGMGAAGHGDGHRVEERSGLHLIAEALDRLGEDLRQAVGALGRLPDALGPVIDGEHRGDDRQQHLRGADIAGRLLAADMLLARLHRHAQRRMAVRSRPRRR